MFKKILFVFLVLILGAGVFGYFFVKNLTPEKIFQSNLVQEQIKKNLDNEDQDLFNFLPRLLGFNKPMVYLFLFENNTEMRPGGGFIGSYAVVKIINGRPEILKLEGTETLDKNTPKDWNPEPPAPIKLHLGMSKWYFRDANWSPDFAESAKKALELYAGEKGVEAGNIDMVVAFTPTVLEKIMEITGPVTVDGITFESKNVTEKLEYEVEYGYGERGIEFHQRKDIMKPFFYALINSLKFDALTHWKNYLSLVQDLVKQKQIIFFSPDLNWQRELDKKDWTGRVKESSGDYLLWVDANLASLKTDHVITRGLKYNLEKRDDGRLVAIAEMTYKHNGKFDWRTSRYRTYARIYVPDGAELISYNGAMKWDRTAGKGEVDQGKELNKKWFGAFIAIEPGKTGKLSFSYLLPENVSNQLKNGSYKILVQKQLGLPEMGLTVEFKFGTNTSTVLTTDKEFLFYVN